MNLYSTHTGQKRGTRSPAASAWNCVSKAKKVAYRDTCANNSSACWICDGVIDYGISDPCADWGFSIDHEKPKQFFPDLVGVEANWRPAHRRCNSERGSGGFVLGGLVYRPFGGLRV